MLEKNWSALEDDFRTFLAEREVLTSGPLVPNHIRPIVESY